MPSGILPDEGIALQLECILKRTVAGISPWSLILWTNDITPTFATVLADLTEATFLGYTRVTLDRSTWTTPTVHDGCAHSTWGTDAIVWNVTGGPVETLYGYAMIDPTMNVIRFVQRFDAEDIAPIILGGKVLLLPEYTLTSAECV